MSDILKEAQAAIAERMKRYGHPTDNFLRIAAVWNWYLTERTSYQISLGVEDIPILFALAKVARLIHSDDIDSVRDIAGYMATWGMLDVEK